MSQCLVNCTVMCLRLVRLTPTSRLIRSRSKKKVLPTYRDRTLSWEPAVSVSECLKDSGRLSIGNAIDLNQSYWQESSDKTLSRSF